MPVLLITGMHRSGTSLTASLLQSAGLFIGDRLMPAGPGNEAGHFEDMEFYEFHRRALRATGHADDGLVKTAQIELPKPLEHEARQLVIARESLGRPWGWKDPRTVLFLDHWHRLLPHSFNLFVFRAPWEVVDSLYRRSDVVFGVNPGLALDAWYHYNLIVRDFATRHSDTTLIYELPQVITDTTGVIASIRKRCGIPLENPQSLYREGMLDRQPDSHHIAVIRELAPKCAALYGELQALAGVEPRWKARANESSTKSQQELCTSFLTEWAQVRHQQHVIAKLQADGARLREEQEAGRSERLAMAESHQAHVLELERRIGELESSRVEASRAAERERDAVLRAREALVTDCEQRIKFLQSQLAEMQQKAAEEHGATVAAHQAHALELERRIGELELSRIEDSRAAERELDAVLRDRKALVTECEQRIEVLQSQLVEVQQKAAEEHGATVAAHQAHALELERRIGEAESARDEASRAAQRERDAIIRSTEASAASRERRIEELESTLRAAILDAEKERERQCDALSEQHRNHVLELQKQLEDKERQNATETEERRVLEERLSALSMLHERVVSSNSWRATRPLRVLRRLGMSRPYEWLRTKGGVPRRQGQPSGCGMIRGLRWLYDRMPINMESRLAHRRFLARRFPRLLLASGSPAATIPGLVCGVLPTRPIASAIIPKRQASVACEAGSSGAEWESLHLPKCDTPLVSIIIPVHNQWSYTYACVRSIVQGEPVLAYEIILADDVSTDETRWADRHIKGVVINRNTENLGFLRNCNSAASRARGEYLLFLNNDTEIQAGAITELLKVFRTCPDAGLVGSKLIYPDGRLQEAGGIVWNDGSAWNYGQGQNPGLGEFNYLRETDYCSGASIMVPRPLFHSVGGFDDRYAPAYYEDTDLAFAVRHAGRKVYYQPASVVVHHEGVSHGTDEGSGIKSRQLVNRQRFVDKWRTVLSGHAANAQDVFHARDRSAGRQTILVIDHYVPQPDRDAGSRVMWSLLKLYRAMGLNVKFLPHNLHYDEEYARRVEQLGVEVLHGSRYVNGFVAWLKEHGGHIDYVLLSRPHIAVDFLDDVRLHSRATLLYYGHDLHHARLLREAAVTGNETLKKKAAAARELEVSIWNKVDVVYYPSAEETAVVTDACPNVTARTVPLYFFEDPLGAVCPGPKGRQDIVFVAGFAHPPNVDAAIWLVKEIMPLVRSKLGDVRLWLIGSNPTPEVQRLGSDNVTVTGYVTDERLGQLYRECRVAVVPLRFGAGVKSKVIEAMYHGVGLVTTPVGAQGLPGLDAILPVRESPIELADAITALATNDTLWTGTAAASRKYIAEHFSLSAMRAIVEADIASTNDDDSVRAAVRLSDSHALTTAFAHPRR
jgi:GT2 family glycosyltransferase